MRLEGGWREWVVTGRTALTIGVYDGVHRAHQAILERTASYGLRTAVLTFAVHPASVLSPGHAPTPLMSLDDRVRFLEIYGADVVAPMPFDSQAATMLPEVFVEDVVVGVFNPGAVVVGSDFRFGSHASGSVEMLREFGEIHGFETAVVDDIVDEGVPIRSSVIRQRIRSGDVVGAAHLLGRPHMLSGTVVPGDGRGKQIGFPTANLADVDMVIPARGVYAVTASVDGSHYHGVANIGVRPTFGGHEETLEVHLFDTDSDLYGATMRVWFREYLRGEEKFPGVEALIAQITVDCDAARAALSHGADR